MGNILKFIFIIFFPSICLSQTPLFGSKEQKEISFNNERIKVIYDDLIDSLENNLDEFGDKGYIILEYSKSDFEEVFSFTPSFTPPEDYLKVHGIPIMYGYSSSRLLIIHSKMTWNSEFLLKNTHSKNRTYKKFFKEIEKHSFNKVKGTKFKNFREKSIVFVDNSALEIKILSNGDISVKKVGY